MHISFFFDLVSSRFLYNYQPNCRDRIIRKKERKEIPLWTDTRYTITIHTIHDTMHLLSLLALIGLLGSSAVTAFPYRDSPYFRGNDCNNRCDAWSACMRSGLSARCTPVPTTQCKCFDNPPPSMLSLFFFLFSPVFWGRKQRMEGERVAVLVDWVLIWGLLI